MHPFLQRLRVQLLFALEGLLEFCFGVLRRAKFRRFSHTCDIFRLYFPSNIPPTSANVGQDRSNFFIRQYRVPGLHDAVILDTIPYNRTSETMEHDPDWLRDILAICECRTYQRRDTSTDAISRCLMARCTILIEELFAER